jgi:hypothetical protein
MADGGPVRIDVDAERARAAAQLQAMIDRLMAAQERGEVEWPDAARQVLDLTAERAKLLNLYPAERVVIVDDETSGPSVDPAVVDAVRKVRERWGSSGPPIGRRRAEPSTSAGCCTPNAADSAPGRAAGP